MSDAAAGHWAGAKAPSLAEIEALADAAFAALPVEFRVLCAGVRIHVDDFPDDETLTEMGCESEFDLLGLFRGVGLAQAGDARHQVGGHMLQMALHARRVQRLVVPQVCQVVRVVLEVCLRREASVTGSWTGITRSSP